MSDRYEEDDGQRCTSAALVMPEMIRRCCAYEGHDGEHIWLPVTREGSPRNGMCFTWSDFHADDDTVTIWSPSTIDYGNQQGEQL